MAPSEDAYMDTMSSTGSKRFTKHMIGDMAGWSVKSYRPSGFPKEVLKRTDTNAVLPSWSFLL